MLHLLKPGKRITDICNKNNNVLKLYLIRGMKYFNYSLIFMIIVLFRKKMIFAYQNNIFTSEKCGIELLKMYLLLNLFYIMRKGFNYIMPDLPPNSIYKHNNKSIQTNLSGNK